MLKKFYPKAFISSLADISPAYFTEKGIRGLILDLDNTIIPWHAGDIGPEAVNLVKKYRDSGLQMCVVSNALDKRVTSLLEPLGIPWVSRAVKPRRKPFLKALGILGTLPEETAMVGDQIFTDILGGNRLGLFTVLVLPISKKEFIGTRLVRIIEKLLILRLAKQGITEIPRKEDDL